MMYKLNDTKLIYTQERNKILNKHMKTVNQWLNECESQLNSIGLQCKIFVDQSYMKVEN